MTGDGTFDPGKHLRELRGRGGPSQYLDVKWRLVWLRSAHPEAQITTEHISITDSAAIFRAVVVLPGGGSATGYGSETAADFGDFIEKAETKAIGRALAALGYGTQFVGEELDEQPRAYGGDEDRRKMRIVDAPVDFATTRGRPTFTGQQGTDPGSQRATERQVKFIYSIAREARLDEQELAAWSTELYGQDVDQLNRRDASTLIEAIQRRRSEVQ